MKSLKITLAFFIALLLLFNLYNLVFHPDPYTRARILTASLSQGDHYFGRLSLWYLYARDNNWSSASALEPGLDPADIAAYKNTHDPAELKKNINQLVIKADKTVEDWLELARIQSVLGKTADAKESLLKAKTLDPVRDDISSLYYKLSTKP